MTTTTPRTPPPSPLAQKLAQCLFKSAQHETKAQLIDQAVHWHHLDEIRRAQEDNRRLPQFCGNVRVFTGKTRAEFLELQLMPAEPPDLPFEVQIKRYAVPGRYWVYGFQWHPSQRAGIGSRLVYGAEGNEPLSKALPMVLADLERPQVLGLIREALGNERVALHYRRDLQALLRALAPRSKATRLAEKLCGQTLEARKARLVAAGRISPETPLPS